MPSNTTDRFSVEEVFDDFVKTFGGRLVRDLIENIQPSSNADYLFEDPGVVAELKCLERETFNDDYKRKMQQLTEDWARRRLLIVFGTRRINLKSIPQECQLEWLRLLETPLQNHVIASANKQIRATKKQLGKPTAKGLLLLVSDGNFSLQPADVLALVSRILNKRTGEGERQYSNIHGIAYFSLNMRIQVPGLEPSATFWMGGSRDVTDTLLQEFIDSLDKAWHEYFSRLYGQEIPRVTVQDEDLEHIRFVEPVVPGWFYVDDAGRKYKCLGIEGRLIRWMLLDSHQHGRVIDAEFTQNEAFSHYYKPLQDEVEAARLEARYQRLNTAKVKMTL